MTPHRRHACSQYISMQGGPNDIFFVFLPKAVRNISTRIGCHGFLFKHTMDKQALIEKIQTLDGLTNDEKSDLLGLLRAHKKYGLVWEDKPEDVEERLRDELPVLTEVKERALVSSAIAPPRQSHFNRG